MKRDMDLIRLLLMRSASHDIATELEKYPSEMRAFHVALLQDAGYVIAAVSNDQNGLPVSAATIRLTWQGYEFLQLMLDGNIWNRAKKTFIDKGVPWATPLLVRWLKMEACRHIPGLESHTPPDTD